MSIITLREPDGPYKCEIDTDVMEVEIQDTFLGVGFVTQEGQRLDVCMRDGGFEVRHNNGKWVEFK